MGVLHLPSSVLHILSCKSGASHGVLYMPTGVLNMPLCTSRASLGHTEYAIMYIRSFTWCLLHLPSSVLQRPSSNIRNNTRVLFRSFTWVYCICHQVVCISSHVNQEPHMVSSEAYKSIKCTAFAIMYIRSLTWVYFISHQVYC